MIKTVWIPAYFNKNGRWEEYEEPTGEMKKNLFGKEVAVTAKKKRWVELDSYVDDRIDGGRLARDTETVLNQIESAGYEVLTITPVLSGRSDVIPYAQHTVSRGGVDTCASWGFSVTEGVMVTAKKAPDGA